MKLSVKIPQSRLASVIKKIQELNKKAAKIGVCPILLTSIPTSPLYQTHTAGDWDWTEDPHHEKRTGVFIERVELTLEGESPKYEGWTFLATLSPNGDKNLLLLVPGHTVDLSRYVEVVGVCEHCNKIRRRKETFVVQHENGDLKAVGRSCLKDFLGHQSPEQIANYAAALCCLEGDLTNNSDMEETESLGTRETTYVDLYRWLCVAAAFHRIDGFVSRARADETGNVSTNVQMMNWMFGRHIVAAWKERYVPTESDKETAAKTIEWMKALEPSADNFRTNLKTLAETGCVSVKGFGLATCAVPLYLRHISDEAKRAASPVSNEYVAAVGEKIQEEVQVIRKHCFDSYYGQNCVHTMVNDKQQTIVWFASNTAEWLEIGCRYKITAVVKKHYTFRSINQTTVSRLKVIENFGKLSESMVATHTPAGEPCAF